MKSFALLSTLLPLLLTVSSFAQSNDINHIADICAGKNYESPASMKLVTINDENLAVFDRGFCNEYNKSMAAPIPSTTEDKWKIRLYASNSSTTYFNSSVHFQSTRYNVVIKDYHWAERTCREYFQPKTWAEKGNNPFQVFDEPTNTFMACIEKSKHQFCLSAFHPKFLQARDQVTDIEGNIDGTEVHGVNPINKPFDGYDQVPGESELVRNENTYRQMTFEIGYGYRLNLLTTKFGSITYVPSIGIGVMAGQNLTVMIKQNEWWEFDDYTDRYRVQGFGGSITNRIELNSPKERFGIFYENKLAYYHQHHGFLDGTQTYNIGFMGNSVGVKFMIYNPLNHKKRQINETQP